MLGRTLNETKLTYRQRNLHTDKISIAAAIKKTYVEVKLDGDKYL